MKKNRTTGFTLVELLVVIVIIVTVAALIVGGSLMARRKAKTSRAQAEIAAMENAIESFKSDNGYYPYSTAVRATTPQDVWKNSALLYAYLTGGPKVYFVFSGDQLRTNASNPILSVQIDTCPNPTSTNIPYVWMVDPFGNAYNYFRSCSQPQTNQATFDLWSFGPDGKNDEGTNDDITNWTR